MTINVELLKIVIGKKINPRKSFSQARSDKQGTVRKEFMVTSSNSKNKLMKPICQLGTASDLITKGEISSEHEITIKISNIDSNINITNV